MSLSELSGVCSILEYTVVAPTSLQRPNNSSAELSVLRQTSFKPLSRRRSSRLLSASFSGTSSAPRTPQRPSSFLLQRKTGITTGCRDASLTARLSCSRRSNELNKRMQGAFSWQVSLGGGGRICRESTASFDAFDFFVANLGSSSPVLFLALSPSARGL